jgi:hypothetical protein
MSVSVDDWRARSKLPQMASGQAFRLTYADNVMPVASIGGPFSRRRVFRSCPTSV